MVKLLWQPTWEAAELLLAKPDFKIYVDSCNMPAQALSILICGTCRKAKTSETMRFITETVNPQVDIQPTWKWEIWVREGDLIRPGSHNDFEGELKIPEHRTHNLSSSLCISHPRQVHRDAFLRTSEHSATCLHQLNN
jgi:hypothetical protein